MKKWMNYLPYALVIIILYTQLYGQRSQDR